MISFYLINGLLVGLMCGVCYALGLRDGRRKRVNRGRVSQREPEGD